MGLSMKQTSSLGCDATPPATLSNKTVGGYEMDIIAWIMDPVRYEAEISEAYWGAIYAWVDSVSAYLTQMGYPPVG